MIPETQEVKLQPTIIFFDAAGTLIHPAQPVGLTYAEYTLHFGGQTNPLRMEEAFRQAWRNAAPRMATHPLPRPEDDLPWWRALALNALSRGAELPENFDRETWFTSVYQHFAQASAWAVYEDVLPTLQLLRNKARLAVISNFDTRLHAILAGHGLRGFFEEVIISSEVGCEKPDPIIFRHALKTMGASAAECLHVGDDPARDWQAAAAVGLQTFHLKRPANSLRELTP